MPRTIAARFKHILFATALLTITSQAYANDKLTVMLDWFVNPNHGPIIIAQQQGLFKQEGLDVTIQEPADPTLPPKMVAAGKVDMAVTYEPNFVMDLAQGLPLKRSATLIATPLNTILTLDNGKINSVQDLKGKTVGIAVAGTEDAMVGTMLRHSGLKLSDIKMVNVGWNLSASLASGKVDAVWGGLRNFEPNQLAIEKVKVKAFYPEEYGVPSYEELIFVVSQNSKKTAAIAKFNHALTLATQYIVNHPDQAWNSFKSYNPKTLDTQLNQHAWADTLTRFSLRPTAADVQGYKAFADFMYQNKVIKTAVDPTPYL
ncbi:ABC transporter substrate-binding protein [Vibrio sp. S11_S32]|uniref:ABC transporter substrate-binding protein n=1 Tax=Vibrio sp. S11_S32 TaxID=2720225 RepID=UPI001680A1C9|nr:ABC transporter substrate-binding protein [Vibrio sp. S11_S32]MBD1575564.1 ABC transporter substrate-binding protein [Vibrio sp. S11_S32]